VYKYVKNQHPIRYGSEATQVFLKVFLSVKLHPRYQLLKITVYSFIVVD